jgi:hypothetical protein
MFQRMSHRASGDSVEERVLHGCEDSSHAHGVQKVLSFDHVIVTVADLDAAGERILRDHGLASVPGGRHEGHGTANRIIPLGPDYIELMAVVEEEEATASPLGAWVLSRVEEGEGPAALCLRTDELDGVAARLDLAPMAMSRSNADGALLSWRLAGLEAALTRPPLPFFIQWDMAPDLHPGRIPAPHRTAARGIAWVEVSGDRGELARWLGMNSLDIRAVDGAPGIRAVGIATKDGELVLR